MIYYVILSLEHTRGPHLCWWKSNRCGYTEKLNEAGRYSKQEADDILKTCDRGDEYAVPEEVAVEVSRLIVPRNSTTLQALGVDLSTLPKGFWL